MNHKLVCKTTAFELWAKKFPQPEPQEGQTWYVGNRPAIIRRADNKKVYFVFMGDKLETCSQELATFNTLPFVFIPSASDIKLHLWPLSSADILALFNATAEQAASAWLAQQGKP